MLFAIFRCRLSFSFHATRFDAAAAFVAFRYAAEPPLITLSLIATPRPFRRHYCHITPTLRLLAPITPLIFLR